jgi:hypothetical protein
MWYDLVQTGVRPQTQRLNIWTSGFNKLAFSESGINGYFSLNVFSQISENCALSSWNTEGDGKMEIHSASTHHMSDFSH